MLKFLRKYQLIVLAIGGSLLMVIFLVQPILQQVGPNPMNRKVAEFAADGEKVTRGDRSLAAGEVQVLERFFGRPFVQRAFGLDASNPEDHWLLLKHDAEMAGLIGETSEAQVWLSELINAQVIQTIQQRRMFGQSVSPEEQQALADQIRDNVLQNRERIMSGSRLTPEQFDGILTRARGVLRLNELFIGSLRVSDRVAKAAFAEQNAGALADVVFIGPSSVMGEVPEPTEEQIAAHVAEYESTAQGDTDANPYGIGYLLPPRVKLAWLKLDRDAIRDSLSVDRVEVRKRWQRENPGAPADQFAEDRDRIEALLLEEETDRVMDLADEAVRGELLKWIRTLERRGNRYEVTDEAVAARPSFESLATSVVQAVEERAGVTIPLPSVTRRNERWFTASDIRALPIGSAAYTVGGRQIPVPQLPLLVQPTEEPNPLPAQVGVPIIEPFATDFTGSNFYIVVLDAREESPPDSIDEIRGQAIANWKSIQAYEILQGRLEGLVSTAETDGLEAAAGGEEVTRSVLVRRQTATPMDRSAAFDRRITEADPVRDAIVDAALGIPPLAPADAEVRVVGRGAPQQFSIAVARVRAHIPATAEEYRVRALGYQGQYRNEEIVEAVGDAIEAGDQTLSPFSYAALKERYQYEVLISDEDDG